MRGQGFDKNADVYYHWDWRKHLDVAVARRELVWQQNILVVRAVAKAWQVIILHIIHGWHRESELRQG